MDNSALMKRAKEELLLAGFPDSPNTDNPDGGYDSCISASVFELLETFSDQGHSGTSAQIVLQLFNVLAGQGILTPLTGEDSEWIDQSEATGSPFWQNRRLSSVFKDADGKTFDINGIIFMDKDGSTYTDSEKSSVPATFPYMPNPQVIEDFEETLETKLNN